MSELTYLTVEGMERIKKDLHELRTKGRSEIAKAIQEAREKGDLAENAEYHAAKESQGMLEMKIAQLEDTLSNARLVDMSRLNASKVMLLSKVKLKNVQTMQIVNFMLVSESEADLKVGKISISSPIGKGLLGKVIGDVAEIVIPAGVMKLEVLEIAV
jgi:transcription elongation factor GreA